MSSRESLTQYEFRHIARILRTDWDAAVRAYWRLDQRDRFYEMERELPDYSARAQIKGEVEGFAVLWTDINPQAEFTFLVYYLEELYRATD